VIHRFQRTKIHGNTGNEEGYPWYGSIILPPSKEARAHEDGGAESNTPKNVGQKLSNSC